MKFFARRFRLGRCTGYASLTLLLSFPALVVTEPRLVAAAALPVGKTGDADGQAFLMDLRTEAAKLGLATGWIDELIRANDLTIRVGSGTPLYEHRPFRKDRISFPTGFKAVEDGRLVPYATLVARLTARGMNARKARQDASDLYSLVLHEAWHQWINKFGEKTWGSYMGVKCWDEVLVEALTHLAKERTLRDRRSKTEQILRNAGLPGYEPRKHPFRENKPKTASSAWVELVESAKKTTTWTEEGERNGADIKDMPQYPRAVDEAVKMWGLDRTPPER
jgi:hypothetical protein